MRHSFRAPLQKAFDFEIVDDNERIVGHVRLMPNRISWKSKGKQRWRNVTLEAFETFMQSGNETTK